MEDIFGGPGPQGPTSLGTGPGVIGGDDNDFGGDHYNNYRYLEGNVETDFNNLLRIFFGTLASIEIN